MTKTWKPGDPKACSLYKCSSENVEYLAELTPSGDSPKVRCENGHVTNGIPAREFRVSA
jgi:hypothetical protein